MSSNEKPLTAEEFSIKNEIMYEDSHGDFWSSRVPGEILIHALNKFAAQQCQPLHDKINELDALLYKFYGLVNKLDKWSIYPKEEILEINQEYNNQKEK